MDFRQVDRSSAAFQQSISPADVLAICQRAFGSKTVVRSAVELGSGMYNSTYRIILKDADDAIILRVAPSPGRQFNSERELMRNEYATLPYLGVIAPLMPNVIAADWSHTIIDRDYMIHTLLPGIPGPERLGDYPRESWRDYFRQLGTIARCVHGVEGSQFGVVAGPAFNTWSDAFVSSLHDIAADLDQVSLASDDIRRVAKHAYSGSAVLDEIDQPRLLTGDLWTINVMLAENLPKPTITGVFDLDRTWWGDPAADWTIRMAHAKRDERQVFWESYGTPVESDAAAWRAKLYEVRHLGAIRLERFRLGNNSGVDDTYAAVAAISAEIG
jgi:aminoglycoside phosphotransferase (APT) family kinase protein